MFCVLLHYFVSFYICVQLYRPLPPGGNSIPANKYHISLYSSFQEPLPAFRRVFHIDDHRKMIRMRDKVEAIYSCQLRRETETPRDDQWARGMNTGWATSACGFCSVVT